MPSVWAYRNSDLSRVGLVSADDKIVTWLDPKHGTEIVTAQYGAYKAGVTLVPIMSENPEDFFQAVGKSQAKAAIISPNRRVAGNLKQSEALANNFTELKGRRVEAKKTILETR